MLRTWEMYRKYISQFSFLFSKFSSNNFKVSLASNIIDVLHLVYNGSIITIGSLNSGRHKKSQNNFGSTLRKRELKS